MKLSNETIRQRAIWKAILLTVLPMVISGMGVYLWHQNYCDCQEKEDINWEKKYTDLEEKYQESKVKLDEFVKLHGKADSLFVEYETEVNSDLEKIASFSDTVPNYKRENKSKILNKVFDKFSDRILESDFTILYKKTISNFGTKLSLFEENAQLKANLAILEREALDGSVPDEMHRQCQIKLNDCKAELNACKYASSKESSSRDTGGGGGEKICDHSKYEDCIKDLKDDYENFLLKTIQIEFSDLKSLGITKQGQRKDICNKLDDAIAEKIKSLKKDCLQ